jgi:hypothetical protein
MGGKKCQVKKNHGLSRSDIVGFWEGHRNGAGPENDLTPNCHGRIIFLILFYQRIAGIRRISGSEIG